MDTSFTASFMATEATGSTLQRLAESAWSRVGGESVLWFEGESWSGLELAARARRLSGGLRGAGLAPGDRVVVCMSNCVEVGLVYSAVWRAGAVTTPVVFLVSEDELRHIVGDSGATFVVTTPEFLPKVATASRGIDSLRAIVVHGDAGEVAADQPLLSFAELEDSDEGSLVDGDPGGMAALMYTGGTTGRAKGVMLSHDAMSAAAWAATTTSYEPDLRVSVLPLPLSHAYGQLVSVMGLHAPDPTTTVLMRWFDATGWLDLAEKHAVQQGALVPSMLQLILALPVEDRDLSALRRLASGGAPLPADLAAAARARLPHVELREGYGCTETAAVIATGSRQGQRPGSVGPPSPGVEVRIERADGTDAEPGEDGEICVRGPVLMSGYWQSPESTDFALRGGWFHTGDVGRFDEAGHLHVVDRIKDLIIRGGFNVYPRDVEDAMTEHPDVAACGVVGRPDPLQGEEVVAFVQLRPGATVTPEDLVAYGREHLSRTKYPREVRVMDMLPLTSVGKLDRKTLRTMVSEHG